MTTKTKGWPPERREKQAARMKALKPWKQTTGPKTPEGKEACKNNAYKHGLNSAPMRELRSALYAQRRFLNQLEKILEMKF